MALEKIEQECLDYINSHLEEHIEAGSLTFERRKSNVSTTDIDIYHKIAQALDQTELTQRSGLFYSIYTQEMNSWNICLFGEQDNSFLEKYGQHYSIK